MKASAHGTVLSVKLTLSVTRESRLLLLTQALSKVKTLLRLKLLSLKLTVDSRKLKLILET